ncbi:MAG: phytanoyl-CoA dioxygenase family protein [Verrucomicrobia bacterium]|nr:phytanoyl-CoA dioxygenase family protein [Verrucomicrobiota bacterium]
MPLPLSPKQVRFFQDEGYLIVPEVFPPSDLEPLRRALHAEINRLARNFQSEGKLGELHEQLGFDRQLAAIQRDSTECGEAIVREIIGLRGGGFYSPEMFDLILHPALLAMIGSLVGAEEIVASPYRIRPKLPNFGRGIVPWHQDSGYLSGHCDENLIITCWVPFVDASAGNGCMQILPRTHRGKVAPHHTGGNADFLVIKDEDLPADPRGAITAACPRGGAVFMTNRTPHCSTPNDSNHIRWSVDLRYKAAEVPNNVGVEPASLDAAGNADPAFYEQVNVACYPPEADFVVRSRQHPERVVDYAEYVRLRDVYARTRPAFAEVRHWPPLAALR